MNPRDHHHTPLAATAGVPAYSASSDQPQLMHPTTPVTQGKHHVVGLPSTGATLRRSGSSSSSSSEDDGAGGRRRKKKSITEKIKEKMPGGHKNDDYYDVSAAGVEHQEKKGIMEKIKEKLPGSHNK